jgi:hypothetical protein
MSVERRAPNGRDTDLLGERRSADYTRAEREYSALVHLRLREILEGGRPELLLLRRYADDPARLGMLGAPRHLDRSQLRLPVVERILVSTLTFLRAASPGGPVLQQANGRALVETQQFATRHPHIVIERRDFFDAEDRACLHTEWWLRRTQNQRSETRLNRLLDTANLAVSFAGWLRGR